jgi:hypothetical protein
MQNGIWDLGDALLNNYFRTDIKHYEVSSKQQPQLTWPAF